MVNTCILDLQVPSQQVGYIKELKVKQKIFSVDCFRLFLKSLFVFGAASVIKTMKLPAKKFHGSMPVMKICAVTMGAESVLHITSNKPPPLLGKRPVTSEITQ